MTALLADFFGWIMKCCYVVVPNYYLDIILFTLITKVLQFPLSLWCHRNSLTMVALMPETNRLKVKFWGDSDRIGEEARKHRRSWLIWDMSMYMNLCPKRQTKNLM